MNKKFKTFLISGLVILVGAVIIFMIFTTEPTAERVAAIKETAMLVEVEKVDYGSFRPEIIAVGTVIPSKDIILRPRVSGKIIDIAENFTPGGMVEKGKTLVQVDPADYQNTLAQRKSEYQQARSQLEIEMGRQNVARQEYEMMNEELDEKYRSLVLRKPQLNSAEAQVELNRVAMDQARLELDRTAVEAPFDAQILSRNVNIGSQVTEGDSLARLVGNETYWIETEIPISKFRWLSFSQSSKKASEVKIRNLTAWPEGVYRKGKLYKVIGELNDNTRMVRVLVTVKDPLSLLPENKDLPELLVGLFVETNIKAKDIKDVFRIHRDYLRNNDTVWVAEENELSIRDVNVLFLDPKYAYISEGLTKNEKVVKTNISTVVEGARLRIKKDQKNRETQSPDMTESK